MKSIFVTALLLLAFGCVLHAQNKAGETSGTIQVEITGIKNTEGLLGINLFTKEEGFPSDWKQAYKNILIPIEGQKATYTFSGIPYGSYSVTVMHDENSNNKLDTNFLGIPKEGYGVSNNVINKFSPPTFEDARISLDKPSYALTIKMNY